MSDCNTLQPYNPSAPTCRRKQQLTSVTGVIKTEGRVHVAIAQLSRQVIRANGTKHCASSRQSGRKGEMRRKMAHYDWQVAASSGQPKTRRTSRLSKGSWRQSDFVFPEEMMMMRCILKIS